VLLIIKHGIRQPATTSGDFLDPDLTLSDEWPEISDDRPGGIPAYRDVLLYAGRFRK
jgi:hypothetical protein